MPQSQGTPTNQPPQPSRQTAEGSLDTQPFVKKGWGRWFSRLKVGQKISGGYGLALGVAVVGITAGFLVADYYQREAYEAEEDATEEISLLYRMEGDVLEAHLHQKQLILLMEKPTLWQIEYADFLTHLASSRQVWAEFKSSQGYLNPEVEESAIEQEALDQLSQSYEGLDLRLQQVEKQLQQLNPQNLPPEKRKAAQTQLIEANNDSLVFEFDEFSKRVDNLLKVALEEHEEANESIEAALELRTQIITISLLFSIAIAIFCAISTSRAIAQPIQMTANVAQQVIQTENFDLQAPVTSQDEVGELTTALNQLIWKVKYLLQAQIEANEQLEVYSHTLEQQVETRTHELSEKNSSLEQTLKELERTQMSLIQSEKMSSIGQMVAGVAHEINNPVNFIHGNLSYVEEYAQDLLRLLQLYQQDCPNPSPQLQAEIAAIEVDFLVEDLTKVVQSMYLGTDRIREIVLSLRNFSRLDEAEIKAVNLHEGIDSTLVILNNRLKANSQRPEIQVIKEYGQLPLVNCYAGPLNQVFMNILSNAIDALEESNQERTFEEIKANPNTIRIYTEVTSNHWATVRIADDGKGMSETVRSKLFDPFFTTKSVGQGTGLGLSISYQIVVEKHGGKLSCRSAIRQGTEFAIQIPLQQPQST
ncbi:ATP-binding protein [Phormidesmis sp. 146-12]